MMWILLVWILLLMFGTLYTYNNFLSLDDVDVNECKAKCDRFKTVHICAGKNVDLSSPPPVIDGIKVKPGYRILLVGQDDKTQNGIYEASVHELSRSIDANHHTHYQQGKSVYVLHGKKYENSLQTVTFEKDLPPDCKSFKALKFVPKIVYLTKNYEEEVLSGINLVLSKEGEWIECNKVSSKHRQEISSPSENVDWTRTFELPEKSQR